MAGKYWFKIETAKDKDSSYHYYGSSLLTHEELISSLQRGEYISLNDLLYLERSEYKQWADWDKSILPHVSINPTFVISVMQYRDDPRIVPAR
jgi:hypothetical protein